MNKIAMNKEYQGSSTKPLMLLGGAALAILVLCVGGWSTLTSIRSAVVASGKVVVESNSKRVQHAEGGTVQKLLVKQGDHVEAGDVLIRLDGTTTHAELSIVQNRLFELRLRRARLIAERDDAAVMTVPPSIEKASERKPELHDMVKAQRQLFKTRKKSLDSQIDQLKSRISQLGNEIEGLKEEQAAKSEELKQLGEDLSIYSHLYAKKLAAVTKIHDKKRLKARVLGERGRITARIARSHGQISETELKILDLSSSFRSDVLKELHEVEAKIAELQEREIAAVDKLKRLEIKAPTSGKVHELAVFTVGGVISNGETLMLIVPDDDKLMVQTKLSTTDIDQVHQGMDATIRFSAFNQRTTPEVFGKVVSVSADHSEDEKTGDVFYTVRVRLNEGEKARLGDQPLLPGMPAEVLITAAERTVLSYLVKPLSDQFQRAFREH